MTVEEANARCVGRLPGLLGLCGIGSVAHLPEGAARVATIELKTNLLRTVRDGTLVCERTPAHGGQTTQVWDARVWHEGEIARPAALFRRTQLLLPGERG